MIIVNNNIALSYEALEKDQVARFAPTVLSNNQSRFFGKRYVELKNHYPLLEYCPITDFRELSFDQGDKIFAWDAHDEKKVFASSLDPNQNRLFLSLSFEMPLSFTPFRKKAETCLPDLYVDAIAPKDTEVVKELDYYFSEPKRVMTYFKTRNEMVGRDFSTKFSPFLSSGVLDVKYLYNRVRQFEAEHESNKSTYWIIFELLWREFFYWNYQQYSRLYFSDKGLKGTPDFSPHRKYSFSDLRELSNSSFFSSALNELESTGFLSNRVRQIFASQWLNDYSLNWRAGAYLFEEQLIDYDVYSNYGNWMYLAGVGVDPRGRRYFNVEKQLKKYDPSGSYIRKWS